MSKDFEVKVTKDEKTGIETSTVIPKSSTPKKPIKKEADKSKS